MTTAEVSIQVHITEYARNHFSKLLANEPKETMLRMFLDEPGLPNAEVGIAFCPLDEVRPTDLRLAYPEFTLCVDRASATFLDEAEIDYQTDKMGGQLAIKAPNLRGKKPEDNSDLVDQINYVLNTEINPSLAGHGGMVSLVEITEDRIVVLKFGGGCHGCGMVDVTLKQGIEKTLKEKFPEILAVKDSTDHATGVNPYYA